MFYMATKIMIDAGHGGYDNGASYEGRLEKNDNLNLALALGDELTRRGYDVVYTRTEDVYDSPVRKAQKGNESGADYFISLHRNSAPEANKYSGVQTLVYDKSGVKYNLAQEINSELEKLGFRNINVEERPGLAVLTELFLRNTQFGRNLFLVGGNISVADNLGIKARNYIWSAYIFQGLFAAIGGVVMMTRQFSASGNLALQGPMEVIPMVIVGGTSMAGGRGGALKTVGGVVLLKIIYNAMTMFSIPAPLQPFVKGLILLVVIVSDKYMERRHEKV